MNQEDGDDFRKEIANSVGQSGIVNFIKRSAEDGGLNPVVPKPGAGTRADDVHDLTEEDAEEWTYKACDNLKYFWENDDADEELFDL